MIIDIQMPEAAGSQRAPVPGGRLFTPTEPLGEAEVTYTISARRKPPEMPVMAYLRQNYGNIPLREIDSVFGFVERSTLYGGRGFTRRELSHGDVLQLNKAGIGVRLPMTNHHATREEFDQNVGLFTRYHQPLNSVICTNDDLARWLRKDFPQYRLDASVIKNIKTHRKINEALELYDSVVLPMRLNEDLEFLNNIEQKERIILFANAGCALTCPSKLCYLSISEINKGEGGEFRCSQPIKERELYGMVDFPLDPYIEMGFRQFKLLRSRPGGMTGF
jgi:hypothetical protein